MDKSKQLQQAIHLAQQGEKEHARHLLLQLLREERKNEKAWLWLVEVVSTHQERIAVLEASLQYVPGSRNLRRALAYYYRRELPGPRPEPVTEQLTTPRITPSEEHPPTSRVLHFDVPLDETQPIEAMHSSQTPSAYPTSLKAIYRRWRPLILAIWILLEIALMVFLVLITLPNPPLSSQTIITPSQLPTFVQPAHPIKTTTPARTITPSPAASLPITESLLTQWVETGRQGNGSVSALCWSPDNRWLALATTLGVYFYPLNPQSYEWLPEAYGGTELAFSPDSHLLALLSSSGTLDIWNIQSKHKSNSFNLKSSINQAAFSKSGFILALGLQNGDLQIANTLQGAILDLEEAHNDRILALAFSPNDRRLASASQDGTALLWDTEKWEIVETQNTWDSPVCSMTFSPDNNTLALGLLNGKIILWKLAQQQQELIPVVNSSGACHLSFSPDGSLLAAGTQDGNLYLFGGHPYQYPQQLPGHLKAISALGFSKDGTMLASASLDGSVQVWNVERNEPQFHLDHFDQPILYAEMNREGTLLANRLADNSMAVWQFQNQQNILKIETNPEGKKNWAFSKNGSQLALASSDRQIDIWNLAPPKLALQLKTQTAPAVTMAFSADGTQLAAGLSDHTIATWNLATQEKQYTFTGHTAPINSLVFSSEKALLASASEDLTIRLWKTDSGEAGPLLFGHQDVIHSLSFLPGGNGLLSAGDDSLTLWDAQSGASLQTYDTSENPALSIAVSPDGMLIAAGTESGLIHLWDRESASILTTLQGHTASVTGVFFIENGEKLLSTSLDGSIRQWQAVLSIPSPLPAQK